MEAQAKTKSVSQTESRVISDYRLVQLVNSIAKPQQYCLYRSIAFVSIAPQSGTSSLVSQVGIELVGYTGESAIIVNSDELKSISGSTVEDLTPNYFLTNIKKLMVFKNTENLKKRAAAQVKRSVAPQKRKNPASPAEIFSEGIHTLKRDFNRVLLDCPALKKCSDALLLASIVDGIVLIAEADRTTREQVRWARQTIEMANGKLIGFVLNKSRNPIPEIIERWL